MKTMRLIRRFELRERSEGEAMMRVSDESFASCELNDQLMAGVMGDNSATGRYPSHGPRRESI